MAESEGAASDGRRLFADGSALASWYVHCTQCPRACDVDRMASLYNADVTYHAHNGVTAHAPCGFCGESNTLRIALACLHFGEEPLVTVHGGSGTIFLTGCNLRCAFCQNYQISQQGVGAPVTSTQFADICLRLQDAGAENINLVTGSHHIPALAAGLEVARTRGLTLPVCWNTSGYDSPDALRLLDGLVTVWLPDLKTLSAPLARQLCAAADYPDRACESIHWMIAHNPLRLTSVTTGGTTKDKILQGVIVRHLFLPGRFAETADVLEWLKQHADGHAIISLMSQYTPVPFAEPAPERSRRTQALSALENRLVTPAEDADLQDLIAAYDFDYLFYQELTDDTSWLPDFSRQQPFSNALSRTVWHWKTGFVQ